MFSSFGENDGENKGFGQVLSREKIAKWDFGYAEPLIV